jgi:hypothetical protein
MARSWFLLMSALGMVSTAAADSVVLGKGISNKHAGDLMCPQNGICLDSVYLWELEAKRTVSGAPISGRVKALATQHTDATPEFARSVEIFVMRPIDDQAVRERYRADYYILALSPRHDGSMYCLAIDPKEAGLEIADSQVSVDSTSGYFCFAIALVR